MIGSKYSRGQSEGQSVLSVSRAQFVALSIAFPRLNLCDVIAFCTRPRDHITQAKKQTVNVTQEEPAVQGYGR